MNNNIKLESGTISLPKIGKVKVRQHRSIPENYKLKSVTVSKNASEKYYVSILFEYENQVQKTEPQKFYGHTEILKIGIFRVIGNFRGGSAEFLIFILYVYRSIIIYIYIIEKSANLPPFFPFSLFFPNFALYIGNKELSRNKLCSSGEE